MKKLFLTSLLMTTILGSSCAYAFQRATIRPDKFYGGYNVENTQTGARTTVRPDKFYGGYNIENTQTGETSVIRPNKFYGGYDVSEW